MLSTLLGILAVGITYICFSSLLEQSYRVKARRSSEDLSLFRTTMDTLVPLTWLMYGLEIGDTALIVCNCGGLLTSVILFLTVLKYRT